MAEVKRSIEELGEQAAKFQQHLAADLKGIKLLPISPVTFRGMNLSDGINVRDVFKSFYQLNPDSVSNGYNENTFVSYFSELLLEKMKEIIANPLAYQILEELYPNTSRALRDKGMSSEQMNEALKNLHTEEANTIYYFTKTELALCISTNGDFTWHDDIDKLVEDKTVWDKESTRIAVKTLRQGSFPVMKRLKISSGKIIASQGPDSIPDGIYGMQYFGKG